jgi:DNA-binding response OmpR family regulator
MLKEKPKILMVEEDRFLRKIYKNKFSRAGFEFREAISGDEGLNKVYSEKPDLVLLDLMLPKRSGFDVLMELKRDKGTRKIPVIILSNLAQEEDIKRVMSLGANDYLIKTEVSLSDVIDRVKECLIKINLKK